MASAQPPSLHGLSRRNFLLAAGGCALGLAVPIRPEHARAAASGTFTGTNPLRMAMHVHGAWSEGLGSWDAQFAQAAANGIDVLFMTDHDFRAVARNYLATLVGAQWVTSSTGTLVRQATTVTGAGFRILAESGSATQPASVTMGIAPKPTALDKLRTSVAGLSLSHTVSACTLSNGASYAIVIPLSYHPATGGRPSGNYELRYRFGAGGAGKPGYSLEKSGLRGVVTAATQVAGTTITLRPDLDIAALWPDMVPTDQCFYGLSFVANSPKTGGVADIAVSDLQFVRTQNDPSHVTANQLQLIGNYALRYPSVSGRASSEVSRHSTHMNPFGVPQFFSDYSLDTPTNHDAFYRDLVAGVHAGGGVISWNHPFGSDTNPLLTTAERDAKRRRVFTSLNAVDLYGADILEVGYATRGGVDAFQHLALWDTFSRNARFLTGNGVSDDHSGRGWSTMANGFVTGAWASSMADTDLVAAIESGRVYLAHCGNWPGGELDMIADDSIPMGAVDVSDASTHTLAVYQRNLPPGGWIEILSGPVDYANNLDPGTSVISALTASSFTNGVATLTVSTTTSRFLRATVRRSDGTIVGAGNPIWLLRGQPPRGIPAARAA